MLVAPVRMRYLVSIFQNQTDLLNLVDLGSF